MEKEFDIKILTSGTTEDIISNLNQIIKHIELMGEEAKDYEEDGIMAIITDVIL